MQFLSLSLPVVRTPMMDLLIRIATEHKLSPGEHVLQVVNERSDDFLYYKPSTPIGESAGRAAR